MGFDYLSSTWPNGGKGEEIRAPFAIVSLQGNKRTRYLFVADLDAFGHAFDDLAFVLKGESGPQMSQIRKIRHKLADLSIRKCQLLEYRND